MLTMWAVVLAEDRNVPIALTAPLGVMYVIVSLPGWIWPMRNWETIAVVVVTWAIVGWIVGWRVDSRRDP